MQKFLNLLLSGTVTGGIYAIMASGLVLTYQTSGIFNFAHGAVAFTTAYVYYQLHSGQHIPIVPAAILAVLVFAPLMGLSLDRILLRRLASAPVYARIVGTIGLLVALPNLAIWLVETLGDTVLGLTLPKVSDTSSTGGIAPGIGPAPPRVFRFGWLGLRSVHLDSDQLAVFAAAAVAAFVLWYVVRRTRVGLEMRAVVDRPSLASLRGVNPGRASATAWILTMLLAGLGGVLIAPLFQLDSTIFTLVVFGSLGAVAAGGLRSIPIAFAAGLGLGVVQDLVAGYGDSFLPGFLNRLSGFRSSIPFLLTLIILYFVARDRRREAGVAADQAPPRDHRSGLPRWRRRLPWAVAVLVLAAFSLQWFNASWLQADTYEQSIIAKGLVFGLIFLSFVVVTGLGGMVSLAQATFVTAGGFAAGWALNRDWGINAPFVARHGHLNFLFAAVVAILVAATLGALIALPVLRLGAVALALATFAFAFFAALVPFGTEAISHGSFGWTINAPSLDIPGLNWLNRLLVPGATNHLDFSKPSEQIVLMLVLFGLATLVIHSLLRSASGRAMLAVRSSEVAARTSGMSPERTKVLIFAVSAGIAGLGGVMLGMVNGAATNTNAVPLTGLIWLAVAVVFGVRRPGGALLAGLSYTGTAVIFTWIGHDFLTGAFGELTTASTFVPILFGLGAINLAQNPDGLLALVGHQRLERRVNRERKARIGVAEEQLHAEPAPSAEPTASVTRQSPTPAGSSAPLTIEGVVAGYGGAEVLHGVDVTVSEHSVLALLGANGAGKSTLCSVASGLVTPTEGRVLIAGEDVTELAPHERERRGLLLVPEARGIFPDLTVEENLRMLLRGGEEREIAYARFPILGERRRQTAGLLSGGEQQMLSLAPALARPPKVFIADEPTLGLAPLAAQEVIRALRELRELGAAIMLVEEKAHEVMALADVVAFMALGRIVWVGSREEADEERLASTYLGISD
ncbi:MAG TPA: ATP-binding cassette domain-containing protein [Acidimicrobiia bacterium]|nr:ATP-binding cassette domain-containing protein [Acidimicrobiia bacterium]